MCSAASCLREKANTVLVQQTKPTWCMLRRSRPMVKPLQGNKRSFFDQRVGFRRIGRMRLDTVSWKMRRNEGDRSRNNHEICTFGDYQREYKQQLTRVELTIERCKRGSLFISSTNDYTYNINNKGLSSVSPSKGSLFFFLCFVDFEIVKNKHTWEITEHSLIIQT